MEVELTNDTEQLIKFLGDRIEEIERTLSDDEEFCNKDIDATYQAAENYLKKFQDKFREKLNELKIKLDQIREENINTSQKNKKQFDDDVEEVNQLFSSGKHQEAVERFHAYEKRFAERTTILQKLPKLYMKDIDINQYFSIDKPIEIPQAPLSKDNRSNSSDSIKQVIKPQYHLQKATETVFMTLGYDEKDDNQSAKSPSVSHPKPLLNSSPTRQEAKSPATTGVSRSLSISTRLRPSPINKSVSVNEQDIPTLSTKPNNYMANRRENSNSHTQRQSTITLSQIPQRQMSTGKLESLNSDLIINYEVPRNTTMLMTCSKDHIVVFRYRTDQFSVGCLTVINRLNQKEQDLKWQDRLITSIGFINKNNIYIFTEHDLILYSMNPFSKINSRSFITNPIDIFELNYRRSGIGAVYDGYIYHIFLNQDLHWILSIFKLETLDHLFNYNLTENFSAVKRFIHICVDEKNISFLVEIDGQNYAVVFCSKVNNSLEPSKSQIHLFYAENPLTICSIYIHYLKKNIFFVNDPKAKIIHILTSEKYLKSYPICAYAFSYIEENQELVIISNDGIYSFNMTEQGKFYSKFL